ncbi:MAG: ABC transporter ATP-binding protein [Candidatus Saccharimonadales bacterium]
MDTNKQTLRLYWAQIKQYKRSFFGMLIAIPVAALLIDTALPYFLSQAVGTFAGRDSTSLMTYITFAAIAALVGVGINVIGFQSMIVHEGKVRRDLTNDTLTRLLAKDQTFFANQKIGALTGKVIDFINAHVGLQDLFIIRTLSFILGVGSGVVIIFFSSPLLGFMILGLIVALLVQIRWSVKVRTPYRLARKRLVGEVNGAMADAISNTMMVKTFANEVHEQTLVSRLTDKFRIAHLKDFSFMAAEGSARVLLMSAVQIVAIVILASLLQRNQIELGVAIFTIAYLQRVSGQLFVLGDIINGYDRLFLQAAPLTELLMKETLINDRPHAKKLRVTRGEISYSNVDFAYSDDLDTKVLDSLNLVIPAGQKIGLVGSSGAGKTTLSKLLLRFNDTTAGTITIDGQDIQKTTQTSLRQSIAYVPQEPTLFHRTLRENISYGNLEATDEQILKAARQANALQFINKLPEGLETVVGERGVKLSGGQRQRIAIARAILKDAPILVLDEATSALDSESEKLIQDALDKLMKNRTSIVIAHRLSTIAKLDKVIVLEGGKISEQGTHLELLKNKGVYAKLWAHQSGGFIEE